MRGVERQSRRYMIAGEHIANNGEWVPWQDILLNDTSALAHRLEQFGRRADRRNLRVFTYVYLVVEGELMDDVTTWEQIGQSDETIVVRPPATIRVEAAQDE